MHDLAEDLRGHVVHRRFHFTILICTCLNLVQAPERGEEKIHHLEPLESKSGPVDYAIEGRRVGHVKDVIMDRL